jgi:8-oxo-dGTP pyrophosphatase MutT (NUDIX family)
VYRLRDLPNKRIVDRVSVDRLRHYLTVTDALPLGVDEYLVEELLGRRVVAGKREYRVKFKGYAKSASEWLPEDNLLGRCSDMVRAYEASHPVAPGPDPAAAVPTSRSGRAAYHRRHAAERTSARAADTTADSEDEEVGLPPVEEPPLSGADPAPDPYPLGRVPSQAKFERGVWMYRIEVTPRRAMPGADKQVRWMPEHHFSSEERLDFAPLRDAHTQSVSGLMMGAMLPMCEMDRPSRPLVTKGMLPPTTEKQKAYYRDAEGCYEAAKIVLISAETGRLYCGLRRGSTQVDFVGGHRSWADLSQVETACREVKEELAPGPARAAVLEAILRAPHYSAIAVNRGGSHRVIYYAVHLPDSVLSRLELSPDGERELSSWAARVPSAFRDSRTEEMWKEVNAAVFSAVAVSTERAARRRLNEQISRCAVSTASQGP